MGDLLGSLIQLYTFAIFGRIILSYFPVNPGSAVASISSFLYSITEPVLGPVRRAVPSIGMFDLSPLVVIFGLNILGNIVRGAL